MKPLTYIDDDKALARLAKRLVGHAAIAIDTEANPLFAYRERLCLVQISTNRNDYIVDPVGGADITLLAPVLADPGIVKVFHDAEFDVLMLKRTHPFEICSLFDTKVAAAALGREKVGLAAMLEEAFDVRLDKRFQRSDWGKRPLTDEQLDYAACDTRYLLKMAAGLRHELAEAGEPTVFEVAAECRRLCDLEPEIRAFDPDEFTRIKGHDALDPGARRALRELFVMRHEIAERRDAPAFKVLANDMLLQLARARPKDRAELSRVRALSPKLASRYADRILGTLRRAERLGPLPRRHPKRNSGEGMSVAEREAYEALRAWRKRTAQERNTDSALVLSRAAMEQLARLRQKPRNVAELLAAGVIEPWRVHHYGDELVDALQGAAKVRNSHR